MTIEQLKNLHQATPFRPFTMHLADGRTVIVYGAGESFDLIDLLLVTSLRVQEANGSGKRKRT